MKLCINCSYMHAKHYCTRPSRYTGVPVDRASSYEREPTLPWWDRCGMLGRFYVPKNLSEIVEGLEK